MFAESLQPRKRSQYHPREREDRLGSLSPPAYAGGTDLIFSIRDQTQIVQSRKRPRSALNWFRVLFP